MNMNRFERKSTVNVSYAKYMYEMANEMNLGPNVYKW